MTRPKGRLKEPSEIGEFRKIAVEAGYVSPYPEPGDAPDSTIEDRCESCGWTLFVALDCATHCVNKRCGKHRYDLRQDVPDDEDDQPESV